jgi:serpin B
VNAIWFKANWFAQFDPAATAPGSFTLLDDSQVQVPLMHASLRTGYASTDLFQAVRLPYAGDAAMVVLLPTAGTPADLAAALSPDDLEIRWGDYRVDLTLPSFEFEADIDLKSALLELGMQAAFVPPVTGADDEADFTGITTIRELYVSEALHKTFIALDEDGTEAAAATAIILNRTSRPTPGTFTADRPFLFWIEHSSTGEMLFLGQVTNPA